MMGKETTEVKGAKGATEKWRKVGHSVIKGGTDRNPE